MRAIEVYALDSAGSYNGFVASCRTEVTMQKAIAHFQYQGYGYRVFAKVGDAKKSTVVLESK